MLIGLVSLLTRTVLYQPFLAISWGWPLLTTVIIAPVMEEISFRGAELGALGQTLMNPVSDALAVLLLGWVFGFASHKSKALEGSILTHILNNFFSLKCHPVRQTEKPQGSCFSRDF